MVSETWWSISWSLSTPVRLVRSSLGCESMLALLVLWPLSEKESAEPRSSSSDHPSSVGCWSLSTGIDLWTMCWRASTAGATVLGLRKKKSINFFGPVSLFFIFVTINFLEWLVSFFFSLTLTINFWRLVYFYFSNWLRWRHIVFICFPDLWCLGFLLSAPEQKGVSYWKWTFPDHLGTANKKPWMFLLHPSLSREIDGKAKFRSSEPQICYDANSFLSKKRYNNKLSKQTGLQQKVF